MMLIRLQDAPPQYDVRDQVELRRQLVQALQGVSTGAAPDTAALEARVAALESTVAAILVALAGAGIPVGEVVVGQADFSSPDASGLLALYSIGGM